MFGYVIVNKQEMKFKDFEVYQSYYCGFCQELKKRYGVKGQITVTYDMTFLILLLKGLYEVCLLYTSPAQYEAGKIQY